MIRFYDHEFGSATFGFATLWYQLVVGPTYAHVGTLDLLMTDVPDLVQVASVGLISNSDHSFLLAVIRWLRRFQTCV